MSWNDQETMHNGLRMSPEFRQMAYGGVFTCTYDHLVSDYYQISNKYEFIFWSYIHLLKKSNL